MKQNSKRAVTAMISALALLAVINPISGVQAKSLKGVIKPPTTSKDFKLGPKDSVMVTNEWWCADEEWDGPDFHGKKWNEQISYLNNKKNDPSIRADARRKLGNAASFYLANKEESPQGFWGVSQDAAGLGPGGKVTWENCYTLKELGTAKREALRGARWVMKNLK